MTPKVSFRATRRSGACRTEVFLVVAVFNGKFELRIDAQSLLKALSGQIILSKAHLSDAEVVPIQRGFVVRSAGSTEMCKCQIVLVLVNQLQGLAVEIRRSFLIPLRRQQRSYERKRQKADESLHLGCYVLLNDIASVVSDVLK